MRDFQRGRVAGRKGAAHVWSSGRAFDSQVANLLVATLSGFFSILIEILDHALEDEKIGAALACQLNAIAVVPLNRATKHFAILENDGHGGMGLHLLDPVKIFRVSDLGWGGLLARNRAIVGRAGNARLLDVRKARTEHAAVHHDYSF